MHKIPHPRLLAISFIILLATGSSAAAGPFAPMLAMKWEDNADPTGWWMSEKFDGVRGLWDGKRMWTRKGKSIALPEPLRRQLPSFALDGELWAGRGRFEQTQSTVLDQRPGDGWERVRYLVFDLPNAEGGFEQRMAQLERWHGRQNTSAIEPVRQTKCNGRAHLDSFLRQVEAQGGEGVILRAPSSPYIEGRSPALRKVKTFDDAEARVVGHNPGKGQLRGMTGSLLVELADGTRFSIGSGLGDTERKSPPPLGSMITFKHYGTTTKGVPRFPVYWRIRETTRPETGNNPPEASRGSPVKIQNPH